MSEPDPRPTRPTHPSAPSCIARIARIARPGGHRQRRLPAGLASALLCACLASGPAGATADGPDAFRVTGIPDDAALALHAAAGSFAPKIEAVPAGSDGLVNLGCRDTGEGRWCLVGFEARLGWADAAFLAEGSGDAFGAGGPMPRLAGSAWSLRDFVGAPVAYDAWIGFGTAGDTAGHGGCNRLTGSYEESPGRLAFGPVAGTRMACPEEQTTLERSLLAALEATEAVAARERLMTLIGPEGEILATFTRRDR